MSEADESAKCSFCGKGLDDVLHMTQGREAAICDECVDACIEGQAGAGIIPDLRPLKELFLFNPSYLTENDVRGELGLYEAESLKSDEDRERLVGQIVERIRKDELIKTLAEGLQYRTLELFLRVAEESGVSEELRFAGYVRQGIEGARGSRGRILRCREQACEIKYGAPWGLKYQVCEY